MKLRTEDQLGYFSTQMLGQIALPAVTVEAQKRERSVFRTRGRASGKHAALRSAEKDGVGYVAHVDRASGSFRVVAGPGEDLPGEPLTAALYRAAATTGEHRFAIDEVKTWSSVEEMMAALNGGSAVAVRRCACSRVVPLTEWDGLYDCCSECADDLSLRDHKLLGYEFDWQRLAPEFYD